MINHTSRRKVMIVHLKVGLIIKTQYKYILYKTNQYFSKPYERFHENVKSVLILSNHARKADLKRATGVGKSVLAEKLDLASLKAEGDEIDADKLKTVTTAL